MTMIKFVIAVISGISATIFVTYVKKQAMVKSPLEASENFPAKPKEGENIIAEARGPRPDVTVEAKKTNISTDKFASSTSSGNYSDVSGKCLAKLENIATEATAEIIPETMTENLESFATDNTEKIEEASFDVGLVLGTNDCDDFIDTLTDKSEEIDANVPTCSSCKESELTGDFREKPLIQPIQHDLSQDLEESRIEGKTLSDYTASSVETRTDIDDFCDDIAFKTEVNLSKISNKIETLSSNPVQEEIIQPIMQQHSLEANQRMEGKTLADYKASMNVVKDEFHDDFAEIIEEIRKSQEMLDQLSSDMIPKKSDEIFTIPAETSQEHISTEKSMDLSSTTAVKTENQEVLENLQKNLKMSVLTSTQAKASKKALLSEAKIGTEYVELINYNPSIQLIPADKSKKTYDFDDFSADLKIDDMATKPAIIENLPESFIYYAPASTPSKATKSVILSKALFGAGYEVDNTISGLHSDLNPKIPDKLYIEPKIERVSAPADSEIIPKAITFQNNSENINRQESLENCMETMSEDIRALHNAKINTEHDDLTNSRLSDYTEPLITQTINKKK